MVKIGSVVVFFSLVSLPGFAAISDIGEVKMEKFDFQCQGHSGALAFVWNDSTRTVEFSNIAAFHQAQMLKDVPLGVTRNGANLVFEFSWYYTASYTLTFKANPQSARVGERLELLLNGDDQDNGTFNAVPFTCTVVQSPNKQL